MILWYNSVWDSLTDVRILPVIISKNILPNTKPGTIDINGSPFGNTVPGSAVDDDVMVVVGRTHINIYKW